MSDKIQNQTAKVANSSHFLETFGLFFGHWTSVEMELEIAIGKFLRLSPKETQIITSGLEFGPKARILRALIANSNHINKSKIISALNKFEEEAKRNIFSHSYIFSNKESITFLSRSRGGNYSVKKHRFTLKDWLLHVSKHKTNATNLFKLLDVSDDEFSLYAKVAAQTAE